MQVADVHKTYPIGATVILARDIDRSPYFVATAGMTGIVVDDRFVDMFAIQLDHPLAGAEEWENRIIWDMANPDDRDAVFGDITRR